MFPPIFREKKYSGKAESFCLKNGHKQGRIIIQVLILSCGFKEPDLRVVPMKFVSESACGSVLNRIGFLYISVSFVSNYFHF